MVHLGVGAFHRAHQAVYTDDAIDAEGDGWGTVGVSLRSPTAESQLAPQDGLFTVTTRDDETSSTRLIGNVLGVVTAPADPVRARATLAAPEVSVVTLTVTEKGYGLDPASGDLMTGSGDVARDLATPDDPRSAIGHLFSALRRRRDEGCGPLTIISCDNVPSNGARLARALRQYTEEVAPELVRFVEDEVACPSTMVDRIVPATTDADLARAASSLGLRDAGHVVTEPFKQWVIEDRFAGPRPAWEAAGALIVPNVAPYETAKLRLLNGAHSAIAYLGFLAGKEHVHDVMNDRVLAAFVAALMDEEIAPTVTEPVGMRLETYSAELRRRFENPSLRHATWQIAADGSQKLPQRLLDTIRDRLASGRGIDRLALVVAAWMIFALGEGLAGEAIDVRDPLAERTAAIGRETRGDTAVMVERYLSLDAVFGGDLRTSPAFVTSMVAAVGSIRSRGVLEALRAVPLKSR